MAYTFNRTRTQLANLVLGKLGVLASGATAASADQDTIYEAIDLRLKEIHRLGIYWRKVDKVPLSFSVTAGVNSASATGDILFPISMTISNSSSDEPVTIIGAREYTSIRDKNEQGFPTKALWKGSAEFLFHPVLPSGSATARILYERYIEDTSAGATMDVEVAILRHLANIVCYDVGDTFGVDEARMMRWKGEAKQAEHDIRKLSVERKGYSTVAVDDWDVRREMPQPGYLNNDYVE